MAGLNLNPWKDASAVQQQFILSQEFEVCLMGPRGEGKTEAGIRRMTLHAAEQPASSRPIPWAIVRDTWTNLERTTLKSFLLPHEGSFAAQIRPLLRVRDGGRQIELPGLWVAYLMGMDSIGDLDKLQSLQLGGLWIEEPAPAAAEDVGGGIEERVVTVGVTSLRHPCSYRTVQLTSNYPDEDHWSWRRYGVDRVAGRKLFRIPRGENPHLPPDYRENMERSLAGDQGLLQRLVLGQPGFVCQGEAVTPEYDPDGIGHGWKQGHKSKVDLEPYPNLMGYMGFDGGLNPTCTFNQLTARGHLLTFKDTLVGANIGMRQLCRDHIKPLLEEVYYMVPEWEAIGDPSMFNREQSDASQTAAFIIEDELRIPFRPGPVQWDVRRNAMKTALNKTIDGLPFWCFCRSEQKLHKALRGGWHYRKDPTGRVMRHKPVKDIHCVPLDTEILTANGFKYSTDVTWGMDCYGWKDGELVPDVIQAVNVYAGDYELVEFNGQSFSGAFTPNHRHLITRRVCPNGGEPRIEGPLVKETNDLNTADAFVLTSPWNYRRAKDREFSDDFIRLAAWVMTEGHYRENGQVWIVQKNYLEDVRELCSKFAGTTQGEHANGSVYMRMRWETAYLLRHLMPFKAPSPKFIRMMTAGQRRHFLYEAMRGDGTTRKSWKTLDKNPGRTRDLGLGKEAWRLALADQGQVDAVQHICVTLGLRTTVSRKKNYYTVTIWARNGRCCVDRLKIDQAYSPRVWCPTTKTGFWVARRNGTVFITGNSHPADAASYVACELLSLSARGLIDAYVYPEDLEEAPRHYATGASPVTGY